MRKICFVGGGTMGSVSPLLAIQNELGLNSSLETFSASRVYGLSRTCSDLSKSRSAKFLNTPKFIWIGTKNGPEKKLVKSKYYNLPEAKLKRYFDISNFVLPVALLYSFIKSIWIILKEKPSLIIGAGSYLTVPVGVAGKLLGIPLIIHQQDIRPSLSNQILKHFATLITVTFKKSLSDFPKNKTFWTANPIRKYLLNENITEENMILVMGGGTGSRFINSLVFDSIGELAKIAEVIHITGRGKNDKYIQTENYSQFEFLDDNIGKFLQKARVVICRAGLSSIAELAYLKKASVIIPLPHTHQEDNAQYIEKNSGAVVLKENELDKKRFVMEVKKLMEDKGLRRRIGENLSGLFREDANEQMIKIIRTTLDGNGKD